MSTIIMPCTCKDEYQDARYGKGNRVHNVSNKTKDKIAYCTVCSPSNSRVLRHYFVAPAPPKQNPFGVIHFGAWDKKPERGGKRV